MAEILAEPQREDTKSTRMTNHPCSDPQSLYGLISLIPPLRIVFASFPHDLFLFKRT